MYKAGKGNVHSVQVLLLSGQASCYHVGETLPHNAHYDNCISEAHGGSPNGGLLWSVCNSSTWSIVNVHLCITFDCSSIGVQCC